MSIRLPLHDTVLATGNSGSNGWELTEMTRKPEDVMTDINTALAAGKEVHGFMELHTRHHGKQTADLLS
jgi:hypothetical protein